MKKNEKTNNNDHYSNYELKRHRPPKKGWCEKHLPSISFCQVITLSFGLIKIIIKIFNWFNKNNN